MLSLSLIAVPVYLDTTAQAPELLHQWARTYHYGHQVLPAMAVGTALLYGYIAVAARKQQRQKQHAKTDARRLESTQWTLLALAGLATFAMVPFTWLVMVPTNNELFRLERASRSNADVIGFADARSLVVSWSLMHLTRSLMPLAGAVLGALAAFRDV